MKKFLFIISNSRTFDVAWIFLGYLAWVKLYCDKFKRDSFLDNPYSKDEQGWSGRFCYMPQELGTTASSPRDGYHPFHHVIVT